MTYKVTIVDDHTLLSQAISELVNSFEQFEAINSFKHGRELLEHLKNESTIPDIVLMDVNMPILNGIETTALLREHYPKIKVLALSIEENEDTILQMLKAGAKGYLLKDIEKSVLELALLELVKVGVYYSNTVSNILVNAISKKKEKPIFKERELDFIELACTELTYKEIAQKMFVSPKTVEGYRDSVYEKINIKNRIGLVLYALKNELFKL